jgi:hypothetical protein
LFCYFHMCSVFEWVYDHNCFCVYVSLWIHLLMRKKCPSMQKSTFIPKTTFPMYIQA